MTEPRRRTTARPSRSRAWGCLLRLLKVGGVVGLVCLFAGFVLAGVGYWQYREQVVRNPGPHIDRDHIMSIIAQDSPVYYRDGTTRVGVFFEDEHRQFVPFRDIPDAYVAAIVAAEDGTFWSHPGVSGKHIARAAWTNLQAGETVSGGSTLTQQTAKNLYYRPDRSLRSKWIELLNALRLEAHHDKRDILTFYANQFHVSGNGRGLAIAARYFFDKDVQQLSTLECAFLAGLVKSPSYFDPFLGDDERRAGAAARAHTRTRYVLQRLIDEPTANLAGPWPDGTDGNTAADFEARKMRVELFKHEAGEYLEKGFELDFRRGRFRYDSSAVLDEVRRRLADEPFRAVLDAAGVHDPDSAGLVVVTTLDVDAQREAIYGLWHHLTEIGSMLEGVSGADFVRSDVQVRYDPHHLPRPHEFRLGRVVGHEEAGAKHSLKLDLGGPTCKVDHEGIERVVTASARGLKKDRWLKAKKSDYAAFLGGLPEGAVAWVSVREVGADGAATCDLEVRPELQGSVVVSEQGQIRAMVGGNDNRNFNRATALRQMGSTWKPLVYHAAMELGWRPDDVLDNGRGVFPYSTTFYHPRPDHPPQPVVSMAWAGVNSENLASVWLLYHLTDRLNGEQVRVLAEALGLAREPDEAPGAYERRIQLAGILPTQGRVVEGQFLQAKQEVLSGIALSGHPEDALPLQSLHYGWGFARQRARASGIEKRSLENAFTHLEAMIDDCERQHASLERSLDRNEAPSVYQVSDLGVRIVEGRVEVACGALPEGFTAPDAAFLDRFRGFVEEAPASLPTVDDPDVEDPEDADDDPESRRKRPFLSGLFRRSHGPDLVPVGDVLVDGRLHLSTLTDVGDAIRRRRLARDLAGAAAPGLYDPEVLYWHQDFRVQLGMRYVAEMARQYGVRTDIRQVLSMPLGASEITLEEATALYGGLVTGQAWSFPGEASGRAVPSPAAPSLLIAEIRDVDGNVLYKAEPTPRPVASSATGPMTANILRSVIEFGTGRRALRTVSDGGRPVPLGGKTGTTNDFKNAAFIGYVPRAGDGAYDPATGVVIGAYVGYDDNRPMSVGNLRVDGSRGALPAWMWAARGVYEAGLLGAISGSTDAPYWPLVSVDGLVEIPVDDKTGLPLAPAIDGAAPVDGQRANILAPPPQAVSPASLEVSFEEVPRPRRVAPSTEELVRKMEERMRREDAAAEAPSIWDEL